MMRQTFMPVPVMLIALWLVGCAEPGTEAHREQAPQRQGRVADTVFRGPVMRPAAVHRVVRVRDGDSLTLLSDEVQHEVRLAGVDAPELRQEFGAAAKEALGALVQGKEITFADAGPDAYHRNLVHLYAGGLDVNVEMVRRGLAWHYRAYSSDPALAAAEQEARRFRRGLWAQPNPLPPWEWRHAGRE